MHMHSHVVCVLYDKPHADVRTVIPLAALYSAGEKKKPRQQPMDIWFWLKEQREEKGMEEEKERGWEYSRRR